eukprot:TRINITY_DN1705_c2_g1_i1.p1 TRINITY_DN1705_c2_g1~~TRINITY_DN1705_c2_g1_i1.p1  ORF type:complete len:349 (-),score=154.04 TRINITY_DN1705_c2_g1_i1:182-1228(-)
MAAAAHEQQIRDRIAECEQEIDSLKEQIRDAKKQAFDNKLRDEASSLNDAPNPKLSCKRTLKGHSGKVYGMDWSSDSQTIATAAQDGILLIWDGVTTAKLNAYKLKCSWVLCCSYSPSGSVIGVGGLSNIVTLYGVDEDKKTPLKELEGHGGQINCLQFMNNKELVSAAGDGKCGYWDIDNGTLIHLFDQHQRDVSGVSVNPTDTSTFVSCSSDKTCKLFDVRIKDLAQISFTAHTDNINNVKFHPSGLVFGTAAEDRTSRLFDVRAGQELIGFTSDAGFADVDFSKSGRYIFLSLLDCGVVTIWDAVKGKHIAELKGHKDRVNSLGVTEDGLALGTASWDETIKIWA